MKKTNMPMQLRELTVAPSTIDKESRTFDVVCTTDTPCERYGYQEILEISEEAINLSRFQNGAPVIDSHNSFETKSVVGVIEKAWLETGKLIATVRIMKDDELADSLWAKIEQGILRFVSIGYSIQEYSETIEDEVRVMRATKWTPLELSIVAVPADANAQMRSSAPTFRCVIKSNIEQPKERNLAKKAKREVGTDVTLQDIFDKILEFKDELNQRLDNLESIIKSEDDSLDGINDDEDELRKDGSSDDEDESREDGSSDDEDESREDGSSEDEEKSKRASKRMSKILEIAAIAGLSASETRGYIKSSKTINQVRNELVEKRASSSDDIITKSNIPADKKRRSLAEIAKSKFSKK